jgi:hypothetical protein
MFANPFFHLKMTCCKATVHTVAQPSMFSRSGGFCYYSASNPLVSVVNSICPMLGRPLAYHTVMAGLGRIKICQNLSAVAYRAKSIGKSHCDGPDMPTVAPTIARIRHRVIAKSAGSREPVFTSMDVLLFGLSLKDGRFLNQKMVHDY